MYDLEAWDNSIETETKFPVALCLLLRQGRAFLSAGKSSLKVPVYCLIDTRSTSS